MMTSKIFLYVWVEIVKVKCIYVMTLILII